MVLKLLTVAGLSLSPFESDVISDGTQTCCFFSCFTVLFESDVISDGTQTCNTQYDITNLFESDVISDGTQTQIFFANKPLFRH